jgi:VanZ family protein
MSCLENTKCNDTAESNLAPKGWFIAAGAYYALLCVLSHMPGQLIRNFGLSFWDKAAHFGAYSILGFFLYLGFSKRLSSRGKSAAAAVFIIAVLGGLDEIHQIFVLGRCASIEDVIADVLGGGAGALIARVGAFVFSATPRQS